MTAQQHDVIQGSDEWHELRLKYLTSSEAPAIMGANPNMKRNDLLEAKATQTPREFSRFVEEVVFAKGHEFEALARPILEKIVGEDLYPVTRSNGRYLASYDGLPMLEQFIFEHKQWNQSLSKMVLEENLPPLIYWQLEHELMVCPSADYVIFVVSDGTEENWVDCQYVSVPARREALINGWKQFEIDLAAFVPTEKKAEAIGTAPDALPVLFVEVDGQLTTSSNLAEFKAMSETLISNIKTKLSSDQDFADAATTVKYLDDAEKRIDLVKSQALKKTMSLEEIFSTLDGVKAKMRAARLMLNKQVEADKKNRKNEIVQGAIDETNLHIVEVNKEFEEQGIQVIGIATDMYAAVKGKSNFENMQSAVDDEVARFKIECMARAGNIRKALKTIAEMGEGYMFLFQNTQSLVNMDPDHLKLLIKSTIAEYKTEEAAKETKRVGNIRAVIQGFVDARMKAAVSDNLESLNYARDVVNSTNTTDLGEFEKEGLREQAIAIIALNEKISQVVAAQATSEAAEEDSAEPVTTHQPISEVAVEPVKGTPGQLNRGESVTHWPVADEQPQEVGGVAVDYGVLSSLADPMREAILTVLDGKVLDNHGNRDNEGLQAAVTWGNSPTLEMAAAWVTILRSAL